MEDEVDYCYENETLGNLKPKDNESYIYNHDRFITWLLSI